MKGALRPGLTRREFLGILARSERLEETTVGRFCLEQSISTWPEYDPHALALVIGGQVVGAGGLRQIMPGTAVLWMAACVDVEPYKFLLMRHAKRLMRRAKRDGLRVMATAPLGAPKAKNTPEHLGMTRVGEKNGHTIYMRQAG